MEDKVQRPASDAPTQTTRTGLEIPVPTRSEVMDVLKKAAQPPKPKKP